MNAEADRDLIARDQLRLRWAVALNLAAPGSGLIVLRQELRGCFLASIFLVTAQVALWGLWIAEGVIPRSVSVVASGIAVAAWVLSQWLVLRRVRAVLGRDAWHLVEQCCVAAAEAVAERRWHVAEAELRKALALNDESVAARAQWARLQVMKGDFAAARAAWEAVLDLDETGACYREAVLALERLPSEDSQA